MHEANVTRVRQHTIFGIGAIITKRIFPLAGFVGSCHVGAYTSSTPQALAALRNSLIDLMRAKGWTNIADAIRYYGASLSRSLDLIGAFDFRL